MFDCPVTETYFPFIPVFCSTKAFWTYFSASDTSFFKAVLFHETLDIFLPDTLANFENHQPPFQMGV